MFEPVHTLKLTDLVQAALFEVALVRHAKLLEADTLAPCLQESHTGIDDGRGVVHIAEMRA